MFAPLSRLPILLSLLALAAATGCPPVPEDGCTVIYDDGVATSSSPFSADDFGCAGCADVIRRDGNVERVLCYADAGEIEEREVFDGTVDVNDGQSVVIEVGRTEDDPVEGDLNINEGGSVIVSGEGPTQSIIDGNANVHDGDVVIRNVTFTGDVNINSNAQGTTLAHCRVFGNVNVNAPQVSILDCAIVGNLTINNGGAYLVDVHVGGDFTPNGSSAECDNFARWDDANDDAVVDPDEVGDPISCGDD